MRHLSEIVDDYKRPSFGPCSFLCLVQCGFPLLSGVVLRLGLRKYSVSNLEVAMRWANVAGCVSGTIELLRYCGFADRAKEGPGQGLSLLTDHALSLLRIISSRTSRYNAVGRGISHKICEGPQSASLGFRPSILISFQSRFAH